MGDYVCVLGVYGNGNLGDDALLLAIGDRLRSLSPSVGVVTLCSDPRLVESRYGIRGVARSPFGSFLEKFRLVRNANAIIVGGGTLVRDHETLGATIRALAAVFFWPLIAKAVGVPTLVYAQGLGPAKSVCVRWAIRNVLPRLAGITLRDKRSWRLYCRTDGTSDREAEHSLVACDPVVACQRFDPTIIRKQAKEFGPRIAQLRPYCLVALGTPPASGGDAERYFLRCTKTLYELHSECGSRLLLFPCFVSSKGRDDRDTIRIVATALRQAGVPERDVMIGSWDCLEAGVATIQQAQVVVADRLHALLLAMMAGVPVVGIQIEDKITGCLEMSGVGEPGVALLEPAEMGSERALRVIRAALEADAGHKEAIRQGMSEWALLDDRSRRMLERLVPIGDRAVQPKITGALRRTA